MLVVNFHRNQIVHEAIIGEEMTFSFVPMLALRSVVKEARSKFRCFVVRVNFQLANRVFNF